jgi:hypothetical protein
MKVKILLGGTALALAAATATTVPAVAASAGPARPAARTEHAALTAKASGSGSGQNVSATASSSWQTSSTVWAITAANGVVYVGGGFTSVRPPGVALGGAGQVSQAYLAAFNVSTGALITTFNPTLTGTGSCSAGSPCGVTSLAVSPDGKTLYAGGTFTAVNGVSRHYLAALNASTGAPISSFDPYPYANVQAIALSPDGSTLYFGGNFAKVNNVTRNRAAAVSTSNGALLTWAPNLNGEVTSVAVAPDDSRVLIGGDFTTFNGVTQQAIGSSDPTTGASDPWAATIVPNYPGCYSDVKDIVINGSTAYIAGEGTGGGCFDGDFAANVSDGTLVWQNDCLGATQSLVVINGWLYKGSHAHDCAFAPGGFPQVSNPAGGWFTHHLLSQSLTDGSLGHWTPDTDNTNLGPRVMATDGTNMFLGGGFNTVNSKPQQGFAIFRPTPDATTPARPAAPTVTSTSAGVDSVTFTAVSDSDDGTLSYAIYRSGTTAAIATIQATSWPWALPVLRYRDAGLTPGKSYTYTVTASDGTHISSKSSASAPVTVSATSPSQSYYQTALADNPSFLWALNETSGSTAADMSPNGFTGSYQAGTSQGVAGPITGSGDTATGFDGQSGLVTSTNSVAMSATTPFSVEFWFKSATNTGGKLVGFGNNQTGASGNYDRHVYMMNDGQLVFGVWNNQTETIETPRVYNDGQWHYVVATFDPTAGMALYVDNQLIGTNPNTSAQPYTGYWRVGGDNLNGWNLDPWGGNSQGTTEPNSFYFAGSIGDVAVYPVALSAAQVAAHYAANQLSH